MDTPKVPTIEQLTTEFAPQQVDQFIARLWSYLGESALMWMNGGYPSNPCGFPGYDSAYLRTYRTYRWMLKNPIVKHARSNVIGPIIGSYFQYKAADDSVPEARVDMIEKMFDKLRQNHIADWLRGFDYGWAGFEPVWDNAGGETQLVQTKPLLPERTAIMVDKFGRFTGLENNGGEIITMTAESYGMQMPGLPSPYKAWIYTYDKECGNLYGSGWLENIRETAWKDWLDAYQQMQKIAAKIAGTQAIAKSPPEQKQACLDIVKGLSNGAAGGWLPSLAMNIDPQGQVDLWKLLIDLSKTSLIDIEVLDFGSVVPAIEGILLRIDKAEANIFSGAMLSSRTGMEGKHGTKAEAGVHKDTGMLISELIHDDLAAQLQPLVDCACVLNDGPGTEGSVIIEAPPLVDSKSQRFGDFITSTTAGNADAQNAILEMTDMEDVLDGLDIPIKDGAAWDFGAYLEKAAKQKAAQAPQPMDKPVNGSGKLDPRVAQMSKRLGRRLSGN